MAKITLSTSVNKSSVGTPSYQYDSIRSTWAKCRAVVRGQEAVKAHDEIVHDIDHDGNKRNILLPFSPTMDQNQYNFYKDEAELPGVTAQYARSMTGALLRKESNLELPDEIPETLRIEMIDWIRHRFTSDNQSLFHFLDDAVWEEMQTSYSWIYVDVPSVSPEETENMTPKQANYVKPYPSLISAENVINVIEGYHPVTGLPAMTRFITRFYTPVYKNDNPWHPTLVSTVRDHYIDREGFLVVDEYRKENNSTATAQGGEITDNSLKPGKEGIEETGYELYETFKPQQFGKRLARIPAWPLDGETHIEEPILLTFVNREIGLYNKISRRNHLMYGAATYTPIFIGDIEEGEQQKIASQGLGTMMFLPSGVTADVLTPPTAALSDMKDSIEQTLEELAKLGIRMLAPETTESGIALELRNSSQTATLGTLNMKISNTMRSVIAFMINWRYDLELTAEDIDFAMSKDFSPQAQGEDGMRLVTEWYQMGLIPRSVFINIAKENDFIPGDYNDEKGVSEIRADPVAQMARSMNDYGGQVQE